MFMNLINVTVYKHSSLKHSSYNVSMASHSYSHFLPCYYKNMNKMNALNDLASFIMEI